MLASEITYLGKYLVQVSMHGGGHNFKVYIPLAFGT
jgi:hypothetical protein